MSATLTLDKILMVLDPLQFTQTVNSLLSLKKVDLPTFTSVNTPHCAFTEF
jgi:hypothetical protein